MLTFLAKRLLQLIPTLFFVSVIDLRAAAAAARRSRAGHGGRGARSGRAGADPQAVPPRSAARRAVRLTGSAACSPAIWASPCASRSRCSL